MTTGIAQPPPVSTAEPGDGSSGPHKVARGWRAWLGAGLYAAMLLLSLVVFFVIRSVGAGLHPTHEIVSPIVAGDSRASLGHVLFALLTIVCVARIAGVVFAKMRQPPVVGEIIAGLALGPSVFGRLAPTLRNFLLPPSIAPVLSALSQFGVILYMFLVGLELDADRFRRQRSATVAISHASIAVPFLLGTSLALVLYPSRAPSNVSFTAFAMFCGAAMSVTAFPVLTRILQQRGMLGSRLGVLAMACAAVDDVTAWCLLAVVVGVARADASNATRTAILTVVYVAAMLGVAKPCIARFVRRNREVTQPILALALAALLLSSLATEVIGIHAVFGAFILGVIIPAESRVAVGIARRLEDLVLVLLLPIFFAYAGARVELGLMHSVTDWLLCALVVATACAGKFGGTVLAARMTGQGWRDSMVVAVLMNTRGLVELIMLNIGLELGVLTPTLFAMFVVMAVLTTAATTPLLTLLAPARTPDALPLRPAD
jgi:Kef-type K+ transport system membrane component KefB